MEEENINSSFPSLPQICVLFFSCDAPKTAHPVIAVSVHGGTRESVPKHKTKIWGKEANTEFIFIYIRTPVAWWPRMYFV